MSETARTLTYVVLGAVCLLIAWVARPAAVGRQEIDDAGERFFKQFDPL